MALITCPECGKEISDKAKACPNCGYQPEQSSEIMEDSKLTNSGDECKPDNPRKKKQILIVLVAAVVVIAVILFAALKSKESKARKAYIDNLNQARDAMLESGAEAESICNLTKSVWYNTIYEESDPETDKYTKTGNKFNDDFNDSLYNLFSDSDYILSVATIEAQRESIAQIMTELQNPPDEFTSCYETIDKLYDEYLGLSDLAISPKGSLQTYSESFSDYDSNFMTYYNKLGALIQEE